MTLSPNPTPSEQPPKKEVRWHAVPLNAEDILKLDQTNGPWRDETQRLEGPNNQWYTILGPEGSMDFIPEGSVIVVVSQRVGGSIQVLDLKQAEIVRILDLVAEGA